MSRQQLLQGFHPGTIEINSTVSILSKGGKTIYFVAGDNYFSHLDGDENASRFVLAQLMANRHVRPVEIERSSLAIPHRTLMHWLRKIEEQDASVFFRDPVRFRGAVMTSEKLAECARLMARGLSVSATAREAGINESTLRKAVKAGRVPQLEQLADAHRDSATDKSSRSREDARAASGMGVACTRADERVAAAVGVIHGAATRFESCRDVLHGGLLVGLPALCANGLLSGLGKHLRLPRGFYGAMHVLTLLGFMALGRIRRPEALRSVPPGELGKVLGLDRCPEVKTLRRKVAMMAEQGDMSAWMHECSRSWMEDDPQEAGYLYLDGHVRVYNGSKANLPHRYVSRQRLCLRGTTDYWLNDALGRPFFVVSKPVSGGLGDVLLEDILPVLLVEVPGQPAEAELEANPLLHRFAVVFDREGSTPFLFAKLWEKRIGAITYRKNVNDDWPEAEFVETQVDKPGGGRTAMLIASRTTKFGADKISIPVLEVRRLLPSGHQTAIVTTLRTLPPEVVAGRMFARWCQENFFGYMMQHYDLDGLVQYGIYSLPGTLEVVNPARKKLDKDLAERRRLITRQRAKLASVPMENDAQAITEKSEHLQSLQTMEAEYKAMRLLRRETKKKIKISALPEEQRPTGLNPDAKMLADTVKMIAYRAETALVSLLFPRLGKEADARAVVREILVSSADLEPDPAANTLIVRLHRMACATHDAAVASLFTQLNELGFHHPQTGMRVRYELV